jgi:hypothetical protein
MFLFFCGVELADPAQNAQQAELTERLVAVGANDHLLFRANMRASYCNNYPFSSLSMYFSGHIQSYFGITDPAKDFPRFLASALWWGLVIGGGLLGLLCVLIALSTLADDVLFFAAATALAVTAILFVLVPPPALSWFFLQAQPAPPARIVNLQNTLGISAYSWLNPTATFSPFSVFPRCLCAMLAFASFALRWSGRNGLAYWGPFLVSFVHQSEAPILLATMICCDIAARPPSLVRLNVALPIALTIVTIVFREHMHSILGFSWSNGPAVVIPLLVVIGVTLGVAVPRFRSVVVSRWRVVELWRVALVRDLSLPVCDMLVIMATWLLVFVVSYLVSRHDNVFRIVYFWSELPSRYVGLFQLPVFVGFAYLIVAALGRFGANAAQVTTAALSCVALGVAVGGADLTFGRAEALTAQSQHIDQMAEESYPGDQQGFMLETAWYYLMIRHSYVGGKTISDYFGKR